MLPSSPYDYITDKIKTLKDTYPILRDKSDDYVFSALCFKSSYYKNPALPFSDSDFEDIIVDGSYDGGVDILLSDPNSDASDLVIGQSKHYKAISREDVLNAVLKMARFYKDMNNGHYEHISERVQGRFLSLNSELGEESTVKFVFYTSAPKAGIRRDTIEKKFKEQFSDYSHIELSIFFDDDIVEEIKESESRRPTVESGKIRIDESNNYLSYGDSAAIVNVSAYSIKQLYGQHNNNLLSRNLRYHINGKDIDNAIKATIIDNPESFWRKNNGITIVCDDFVIDGVEVKLTNFSIVNGGQTTYVLHKSEHINSNHDLFLPCKIIKNIGNTEDKKNSFSLEIAKATNSQKAIKPVDLKANSPEQIRFVQAMREVGVFYQTKRGEVVPKAYKEPFLNTDLLEIGKLCLACIYQVPCTSRSKPSSLYQSKYYDPIFNGNQQQIAKLCKQMLYFDYYFRHVFQRNYDKENRNAPNANVMISFAHNARTVCIAFVAFAARYMQGNIIDSDLAPFFSQSSSNNIADDLYKTFRNLGDLQYFIPPNVFDDKNRCDRILDKLFKVIIDAGITSYNFEYRHDSSLTATNYLKRDKSYYSILGDQWQRILSEIREIFSDVGDNKL